jgi:polyvinyl alcohol dehydrogenase (cytochrome)
VASYLGTSTTGVSFPPSAYCADRKVVISDRAKATWNGWSPGPGNTRHQSAEAAGLSIDQVRALKLKWAFGFDGDVTAFSQPTVIEDLVFVGSAGGVLYALHATTGCLQWTFQANGSVRSSVLSVPTGSKHSLLFGDQTGWFYSLEAGSGKLLWKKKVEEHDAARLTASPVANNGVVFVPVASWEESRSLDAEYACCTFRGSCRATPPSAPEAFLPPNCTGLGCRHRDRGADSAGTFQKFVAAIWNRVPLGFQNTSPARGYLSRRIGFLKA